MMRSLYYLLTAGLLLWGLSACELSDNSSNQVASVGKTGEIMVVMDSAKWNTEVGITLRKILQSPVEGLPQAEPSFKLIYMHPRNFSGFIRKHRNILFLTSYEDATPTDLRLQRYYNTKVAQEVKNNPALYMYTLHDKFAKDQELMFLFGNTNKRLIDNMIKNKDNILRFFQEQELQRLEKKIVQDQDSKALSAYIKEKFQVNLQVPKGFEKIKEDEDFIWMGDIKKKAYQYIFLSHKPYTAAEMFSEEDIMKWREELGKKYIFVPKRDSAFMTTETLEPMTSRQMELNGFFCVEYRGLWLFADRSKGGPFLSYAFLSPDKTRIYYLESYIFAPGEDKVEMLRQLEAILRTFRHTALPTVSSKAN
jgi:hypothetical protein